jgi:hypothetical protein
MLRTFLRSGAEPGRSDPCTWPRQENRVRTSSASCVIFAGDVEGEVKEWLATGFEEGREPEIALGLERDWKTGSRAFLRDAICPLLLAQTPLEIPFSCRILSEVVNDIAVAADPQCPAPQCRQLVWRR